MSFFKKQPLLLLIVGVLGASTSSILFRYSQAPSAVTAVFRLLFASALMVPMVFCSPSQRRQLFQVPKKELLLSCVSGICLALHFLLWFESLRRTSVASATTLVCTEVIFVYGFSCLLYKSRPRWQPLAAIAVALTGSVLIALADSGTESHLLGDILALLAALASCGYTLLGKQVQRRVSTTMYTFLVYSASTLVLLAACLVQKENPFAYGWNGPLIGLLLAVFPTLLGHSLFSLSLRHFSSAFVSTAKLCEPVVASILALALFQEIPKPMQLIGGVLILLGLFLYSRQESPKTH